MKIIVINGPNLNMLGIREPDIYGRQDYTALCEYIESAAHDINPDIKIDIYQSNYEGGIVTAIQKAYNNADSIIINPAAYTHTSVAILDALKAVGLPAVEVHLTDISSREPFRKTSYVRQACCAEFIGLGFEGYKKAIEYLYNLR